MKRISIAAEDINRTFDDDSDTEYDLSAICQRSSDADCDQEVEVDRVSTINEERICQQQPKSETPKSETHKSESLPTPSDGWDITPDPTSVENSIPERKCTRTVEHYYFNTKAN